MPRLCVAGTNSGPRTLSYNPAENAVLLTSDVDGGSYELYLIPKDANGASVVSSTLSVTNCAVRQLQGWTKIWCSRVYQEWRAGSSAIFSLQQDPVLLSK